MAMVGAPVVGPTDLLRLSTTTMFSTDTSAWVAATPGTFAARAASEAGTVSVAPVGTEDLRSCFGSTVTSADVEAKSRSKVRVTVSEKIRLPATNATDSTTASAESSSRPLCARKLRRVAFSTGSVLVEGHVARVLGGAGPGADTGSRTGSRTGTGIGSVELASRQIEPLHPLQHPLRRGPLHLVHDPPVAEEEHQVGVGGGARVVVTMTTVWPSSSTASRRKPSTSARPRASRGCRSARRRRSARGGRRAPARRPRAAAGRRTAGPAGA